MPVAVEVKVDLLDADGQYFGTTTGFWREGTPLRVPFQNAVNMTGLANLETVGNVYKILYLKDSQSLKRRPDPDFRLTDPCQLVGRALRPFGEGPASSRQRNERPRSSGELDPGALDSRRVRSRGA